MNGVVRRLRNIYIKLPPMPPPGGTLDYVSIEYIAYKGIGGVTGRNFIFF